MNKHIYSIFILFIFMFCAAPSPLLAQSAHDLPELTLDAKDDYLKEPMEIHDPWEKFNRKMFGFNDWTYRRIFNPIANVYDFLLPDMIQDRFGNVIRLAHSPIRIFNNLFQGKFKNTSIETGRLLVNSSVGIAGIFDPAGHFFGWEEHSEDFGQTLGVWGVGSGRYLVLPLLGPSNTRDLVGQIGDRAFSPFTWFSIYDVEDERAFEIFKGLRYAHKYAHDLRDDYEAVTEDALDPYTAIRHIYSELRTMKIQDGESDNQVFDESFEGSYQ